ncbi:MAG: type II toxin-antitoxin system VapC family toxin [Candidatus Promineifilaceae bacterium]|nr:type II toxin-antitoxin system VapC family toxin [Candidatus Promineifilaceae bacterium]
MYLLDTNACIAVLNGSSPPLVARLQQHNPVDILLCSVVKAELIYGAYQSSRAADNLRLLDRFFEPFTSLPFDDDCCDAYGRMRSDLARGGIPIGPNDLLIAATAQANDLTLITANIKEFGRVAGLSIENWEIPS